MARFNRMTVAAGGALLATLAMAPAGEAQITRAGAVGTLNPVPTSFRAPATFRGHSSYRGFGRPTHYGGGGRFVNHSRGIYSGIGYATTTNVGLGTGISVSYNGKCYRGFRCGGYPTYYYASSSYAGWPLWEVDRRVYVDGAPEVVVIEVPEPDEGLVALRTGKFNDARLIYLKRALERKEKEEAGEETGVDREALRLAGLAAAGEGRFAEAERLMTEAYAEDPSLELTPLRGKTLVGGSREMRKLVTGAVAFAYRQPSAGAWDVVSWLMQAEGRHDMARKMAERAEGMRELGDSEIDEPVAEIRIEVASGDVGVDATGAAGPAVE